MLRRVLFILFCIASITILANEFNGKIILRINGHEHFIPDIIAEQFLKQYSESRDSMSALVIGRSFGGNKILSLSLNSRINKISYHADDNDPKVINMSVTIKNNRTEFKNRWGRFRIGFDLTLNVKAVREDNLGLVLKVKEANYKLKHIRFVTGGILSCFDWLLTAVYHISNGFSSTFTGTLNSYIGKTFSLLPILLFNESSAGGIVDEVDPISEAESVLKSIPLDVSFSYVDIDYITNILYGFTKQYQALLIDVKFLHGYYQDGQFINFYENYTPDSVYDQTFDWGGFGSVKFSVEILVKYKKGTSNKQNRKEVPYASI